MEFRTSSRTANPWFGLIFVVVGIGVSVWGYLEIDKAKASQQWPTVEGRILSSRVDERRETSTTNGRTRRTTKYTPEVRYEYSHEGKSYTSSRVAFGGKVKSSSRSTAQQVVARYPAGKTVKVYCDPMNPETSCLQAGVNSRIYVPLGIGVVFALVGLGVVVAGLLRRRN